MTQHTRTRTKRYASVVLRWSSCFVLVLALCLTARVYLFPASAGHGDAYEAVVLFFAVALAVMAATFVEIILLFVRAAEGDHS